MNLEMYILTCMQSCWESLFCRCELKFSVAFVSLLAVVLVLECVYQLVDELKLCVECC